MRLLDFAYGMAFGSIAGSLLLVAAGVWPMAGWTCAVVGAFIVGAEWERRGGGR